MSSRCSSFLAICLWLALGPATTALGVTAPAATLELGYHSMYNLDFTAAHVTFRLWQAAHPGDPMGFVSNGAAYLFSEFDRLHILELDLFTDDHRFQTRRKLPPDPAVKVAFLGELAKADELATGILARSPGDANAMFAQVLADGLRGDYVAMIEKRNLASLGYMKSARQSAERLLVLDPRCYDAYLAIGVENYLLGDNSAPVRWLLRLGGAQTDKDAGIERLRQTAEKGHFLAPFARLLLSVAALRESDRATARTLLAGLAREFPQNHLYSEQLARIPN